MAHAANADSAGRCLLGFYSSHCREHLSPPLLAPLSSSPSRSIEGRDRLRQSWGSGAVAAQGCRTHTQSAAAQAARSRPGMLRVTGSLEAIAVPRFRPAGGRSGPTAVDRNSVSTGGRAEQASNTARGTLEKRRTCGIFFGRRPEPPSCPGPRGARARGSIGTPASRAALTFGKARRRPQNSDADAWRERWMLP